MHKLSHPADDGWAPFSHRPVYRIQQRESGDRLIAGVPAGDVRPFARLVSTLEPPYMLLYVLHTPRGEAEAGRYQSPPLSPAQFQTFIDRFGAYLACDARFDLWAHSAADAATVVWDRHDLLYAYGPLDRFSAELAALGFAPGDAHVGFEHQHHYRSEFDADARALLAHFDWVHSPLRPEDEQ